MKNLKKNFVLAALATTLSTGAFASADGQLTIPGMQNGALLDTSGLDSHASREEVIDFMKLQAAQQAQTIAFAEKAKARREITELQKKLDESVSKVAPLQQRVMALESEVALTTQQRDDVQNHLAAFAAELKQLKEQMEPLRISREEATIEANNLKAQFKGVLERVEYEVADKANQLAVQERGHKAQLAAKTDMIESRDAQLGQLQKEIAEIRKQYEQLHESHAWVDSSLQTAKTSIEQLQDRVNGLQGDKDVFVSQNAQLQAVVDRLDLEKRNQGCELEARLAELKEVQTELAQFKKGNSTLQANNAALRAELAAAQAEISRLRAEADNRQ